MKSTIAAMTHTSIGGQQPDSAQVCFESQSVTLSMTQVAQLSGICVADLLALMDYGVLAPVDPQNESLTFSAGCVMTLQRADLLRQELAMDSHAFAITVMFLNQIETLESQMKTLQSNRDMARFPIPINNKESSNVP